MLSRHLTLKFDCQNHDRAKFQSKKKQIDVQKYHFVPQFKIKTVSKYEYFYFFQFLLFGHSSATNHSPMISIISDQTHDPRLSRRAEPMLTLAMLGPRKGAVRRLRICWGPFRYTLVSKLARGTPKTSKQIDK